MVTFSLDAEDANEAFDLARPIFTDGANASRLPVTKVVNVEVSLVPADEYADKPHAVPA